MHKSYDIEIDDDLFFNDINNDQEIIGAYDDRFLEKMIPNTSKKQLGDNKGLNKVHQRKMDMHIGSRKEYNYAQNKEEVT